MKMRKIAKAIKRRIKDAIRKVRKIPSKLKQWIKASIRAAHKILKKLKQCVKGFARRVVYLYKDIGDSGITDKELYNLYLPLYEDRAIKTFRRLCMSRALEKKCGKRYVQYIHSKIHHYGSKSFPLPLKQDAVQDAAYNVAARFFNSGERYKEMRGLLFDEKSRMLFDIEVLQKAGYSLLLSDENVAAAVCTGITPSKWAALCKEGYKTNALNGFFCHADFTKSERDSYINAFKAQCFILDEYEYEDVCTLNEGDTFFECGGKFGGGAIWALGKVGSSGTVITFEPDSERAVLIQGNVKWCGAKAGKTFRVVNAAVGDRTRQLRIEDNVSTTLECEDSGGGVDTVRIDDYCKDNNTSPAFIKLDIGSAALSALHGAEGTIRRVKPRIAICAHHDRQVDMLGVMRFLKTCAPSYRFYLKKCHYINGEAVLFAVI